MTLERRAFEIRETSVRDNTVEGYAAVYNSLSEDLGGFVEQIDGAAFKRSLTEAQDGARNIFALWAHESALPIGSTRSGKLALSSDATGLSFKLDTERMTPMQIGAVRDGDMRMSFGFQTRADRWEQRDEMTLRTLLDVDLSEVSIVTFPAYPDTTAAVRSLDGWRASITPVRTPAILARVRMKQALFERQPIRA